MDICFSATFSFGNDTSGMSSDVCGAMNNAVLGRGRANSSALGEEIPAFQPNDSTDGDETEGGRWIGRISPPSTSC